MFFPPIVQLRVEFAACQPQLPVQKPLLQFLCREGECEKLNLAKSAGCEYRGVRGYRSFPIGRPF